METSVDPWHSDYVRMQCELAAVLRNRISWHDRVGIINAMMANRHDYESHLREQEHLFGKDHGLSYTPSENNDDEALKG